MVLKRPEKKEKEMTAVNPYSAAARRKMAVASKTRDPLSLSGTVKAGKVNTRTGNVVRSHTEPLVAGNGEFNAGNKKELMHAIATMYHAMQGGEASVTETPNAREVRAAREARVAEAWADKTGAAWEALGEVVGDEVWETLGREGFGRKTLMIKPLSKGETGRLRIRRKDVTSYFVTTNPNVVASQVRQYFVYPPEFYLIAMILAENKDIEQASGDLLEDKYQDGLEQILVGEDKVWLRLARAAAATSNDLFYFNTFTPTVFAQMMNQVARWGIPVTTAILAFDLWNDIIADTEFSSWFDPVSKHEIVLEGSLGSLMGVQLITDAFRYETLQVLSAGEIFFCGAPQTLGGITQRKELQTKAIDKYSQGKPERGWYMEQIEGMSMTNSRAIIRGQRV
jgi:hypothetical protein